MDSKAAQLLALSTVMNPSFSDGLAEYVEKATKIVQSEDSKKVALDAAEAKRLRKARRRLSETIH